MLRRPRRLRATQALRNLVRETKLEKEDLIYPLFIVDGENIKREISSMEGVYHFSVDMLEDEIKELVELGIEHVILFGVPDDNKKDCCGSEAYNDNGALQQGIRKIKEIAPQMDVICDVCMCEYTSHGHCGILTEDGYVDNDKTLEYLSKIAVSYAKAGADMVAPSDMMDGRIGALRNALDENGYETVAIMAYSAKYASAFYGPFRDAANSAPAFGDRKTYQMDPANGQEALREIGEDIEEGADLIIAKPALAYMDIMKEASMKYNIPIVAYNVSGEYAMVKAAAANGWIDEKKIVMENMVGLKRAGAKMIITYHALDVAKWLKEEER